MNNNFAVNPYPYKKAEENRTIEDSILLQDLFNKSLKEVYTASKQYHNNSDGIRNFIFIVRSYENLRKYELTDNATTLAIAIIIFAIDGIMNHIKLGRFKKNRKRAPSARLTYYLTRCLNREQKLILLNSFVFSPTYSSSVPMKSGARRHVMYKGMVLKRKPQLSERHDSDWCTPLESLENIHCECINWLSKESESVVNHYIKKLSSHLYKMRCSIVHDAVAPILAHTDIPPKNVAMWSMSVSDVYFNNRFSRHYHYESAISRKKFENIFKESLWVAFNKGYPLKVK